MSEPVTEGAFIVTKEHRLFEEFCDACARDRYIGLCHGLPGVGKTWSAQYYTRGPADWARPGVAVLYTPPVSNGARQIARDVARLRDEGRYRGRVERAAEDGRVIWPPRDRTELLLVDEADRLKPAGLEQLRDIYDRGQLGLVLIGMDGLEKRLARYAQLYSRVGFVHVYRPLGEAELRGILAAKWAELGLQLRAEDYTDAEAVAAIVRITAGNFRLVQRLWAQIERIMKINQMHVITEQMVERAREYLVIGND